MTNFFVDTSALAKYYLTEMGTAWVQGLVLPSAGNVILICDLTTIEFFALLMRHQREGKLLASDSLILQTAFLADVSREYLAITLEYPVVVLARSLVMKYPLRPPDALQLASALHAINLIGEPITFICADKDLIAAAQAEGLTVDDPNLHP